MTKKNQYIILGLFLMSMATVMSAQEYFLKTDSIIYEANQPFAIERIGEQYVVGGIVVETGVSRHMFMALYDKNGEKIHFMTRPEIDRILEFGVNNKMTTVEDRVMWNSIGTGTAILYEYNPQFNSLVRVDTFVTFPTLGEEGFGCYDYVPYEDGYLMAGLFTETGTDNDFGLYRVTSDTILKHRIRDTDQSAFGTRIFKDTDGTFLVASEYDDCDLCGSLRVYRFDENLNLLDSITSNGDFRRVRTQDAILDSLGNVVSCSLSLFRNDEGEWNREPLITSLNVKDGTSWDLNMGIVENEDLLDSGWHAIIEAPQGDGYVVAGSARINNDERNFSYATLAKVSTEGDSVWYRKYSTIDTTVARHEFRDVTTTPEGGYMAVGYDRSVEGAWRVLLLKTNSKGLIEPDSMSQVVTLDKEVKLKVASYPNPVVETLYVQHSAAKKIYYTLCDVEGRQLYSFEAEQSDETFIIDVADFASGTYFLSYRDGTGKVLGSEVVLKI